MKLRGRDLGIIILVGTIYAGLLGTWIHVEALQTHRDAQRSQERDAASKVLISKVQDQADQSYIQTRVIVNNQNRIIGLLEMMLNRLDAKLQPATSQKKNE